MAKKTILALVLVFTGVSLGLLVLSTYTVSGGKPGITLAFLAVAGTCIITGTVLAFSRLLDRLVSPVLDEIHKDIEDDIQDLKESRLTNTIGMVIAVGFAALVFSFFVFRFHKLEAMWGTMPVVVPTLIGMGVLALFIPQTRWFQNQEVYTPLWVFLIPTAGLIFSMLFGLFGTENLGILIPTRQESIEYNSYQTVGIIADGIGDVGMPLELPSCDSEECFAMLLFIALFILTFILVLGSALIPHFWLFGGSILLGIMALIAIHDLRVRRTSAMEG